MLTPGVPIDLTKLSSYESWALKFFSNPNEVLNPNLNLTIQFSIKDTQNHYIKYYKNQYSSFTSYLTWKLLQSIKEIPELSFRCVENQWFYCESMPLIFPVALETKERFSEVVIEKAMFLNWNDFSQIYKNNIDEIKNNINGELERKPIDKQTWLLSHFIGNLPYIAFTSFNLHSCLPFSGKPMFYFGKRSIDNLPISITFDHSNADPYLINKLLGIFSKESLNLNYF